MNTLWNTLVFRATLSFTLAVIFLALYNLATGQPQGDYLLLLEIFGLTMCLEIIDYAVDYVPFHSRSTYLCAEFTLMYICFLLFSLLGHWFSLTFVNLIIFSSLFLVIFSFQHIYDHFLLKKEAIEINNYLINKKM
ncbi:MAG: hypothetical protein ACERKN_20685 [Velocimicrobium sp.]